jgi:BirA family biotin operon repressor/biotin-[acetyl-CoA-carboxylase] ligase
MAPEHTVANTLFPLLGRYPIEDMAERLSIGPAVITALLARWRRQGLPLLSTEPPRLAPGFERLEPERVRGALATSTSAWYRRLDCYAEVDSTNQVLLERSRTESIDGHLCLAEHQSAGRGRQGRGWSMPWGAGLCLSLGWRPDPTPACLGITAGIGVVRALRQAGLSAAGLKWPNDILCQDKKLGGILVETRAAPRAPGAAVIGIGLNMAWPPGLAADLGQPHIDVRTALGRALSRNRLAAALIDAVCEVLHTVKDRGFEALGAEWATYDLVVGKAVEVRSPEGVITGEARRLDPGGALWVAVGQRLLRLRCGEVSLRLAP